MRAAVIYESVFGNTHRIAALIADQLAEHGDVALLTPEEAGPERLEDLDLVVVGGPTHAHGMAWPSSKEQGAHDAQEAAAQGKAAHELDEDAFGETLREWFKQLPSIGRAHRCAAFDTRFDGPAALTGRASKGIAHRLRTHGWKLLVEPESFLVDKENELVTGEVERAIAWGDALAAALAAE